MKCRNPIILLLLFLMISCTKGITQSKFKKIFVDTTDNAFDIGNWMLNYNGFFPLFTIITEPAVDNGIGGGILFLDQDETALEEGKPVAPTLYGVGGLYTGNNSWGLAAFYSGVWKHDRIRYIGALVYSSINLNYYRTISNGDEIKLSFNLEGLYFVQEIAFRIKDSRYFLGGRYSYFNYKATFKLPDLPVEIPDPERDASIGGIGPIIYYDNRDYTTTPNKGIRWYLKYAYQDTWLGSDFKYNRVDAYGISFFDKIPKLIFGFRADFRFIWDDYPFFTQPYVTLRGIPAMRYQDKIAGAVEMEGRFLLAPKWQVLGFAGRGFTSGDVPIFDNPDDIYNVGVGARYNIFESHKVWMGLDLARGPEDWTWYIQVGHPW